MKKHTWGIIRKSGAVVGKKVGLRRHPNLLRFLYGKTCLQCLHCEHRALPRSIRVSNEHLHDDLNLCYPHGVFLANMEDASGISMFLEVPSTSGAASTGS